MTLTDRVKSGAIAALIIATPASASIAQMIIRPGCSLPCQSVIASDAVRTEEGRTTAYEASRAALDYAGDGAKTSLGSVLEKYRRRRANYDRLVGTMSTIQGATGAAADVLLAGSAGGTFSVALAGAAGVLGDIAFEKGITLMETRRDAELGNLLETALSDIRKQDAAAFAQLATGDTAKTRARFFGTPTTKGLFESSRVYQDLDPAARALITDAKVNILSDAIQREAQASADRQMATDAEVGKIGARLTKYEDALDKFSKETKANLETLKDGQKGLVAAYSVLAGEMKNQSYRLDALEQVAFKQLPAKQQIEELRSGKFASVVNGMNPEKREEFEQSLEKAAKLESAQEALSDTKVVIGGLTTLAQALGMEADLAGPLKLANQGVAVAGIALAATTGNPIAIMSALGAAGGLFGGRGDPVQGELKAMRKQIMALRRDIYDLRKESFEYHKETMRTLGLISDQIDQNYKSLYSQGENTYQLLAFVERGVNELLLDDLNRCTPVLELWEADTPLEMRRNALLGIMPDVLSCRTGIRNRFKSSSLDSTGSGTSNVFGLRGVASGPLDSTQADQLKQATEFQTRTLQPTLVYAQSYLFRDLTIAPCRTDDLLFLALMAPVFQFGDGTNAVARLAKECQASKRQSYRLFSEAELIDTTATGRRIDSPRVLQDLVSGYTVFHYGDQAVRLASLWEFVRGGTIVSANDAAAGSPNDAATQTAVSQLRNVRDVVNVAIAQENLLAGDVLLPYLLKHVRGAADRPQTDFSTITVDGNCKASSGVPSGSDRKLLDYSAAVCVLARNALLRQNFTLHWVHESLRHPETGARYTYAAGIDNADPIYVSSSFKNALPLVWAQCNKWTTIESWCLKLPFPRVTDPAKLDARWADGNIFLPLPEWQDLAAYRPARMHAYSTDLLSLRARIEDRLASYDTGRDLNDEQRALVYAGVLAAASSNGKQAVDMQTRSKPQPVPAKRLTPPN